MTNNIYIIFCYTYIYTYLYIQYIYNIYIYIYIYISFQSIGQSLSLIFNIKLNFNVLFSVIIVQGDFFSIYIFIHHLRQQRKK